jgi:hypothetical protein
MIGTSRETVGRLFGALKMPQIVQLKGSMLLIRNRAALEALASNRQLGTRPLITPPSRQT